MRSELQKTTLTELAGTVHAKAPPDFANEVRTWLDRRVDQRTGDRIQRGG